METGWELDQAMLGGYTGKGVDEAAHNVGVFLGKARKFKREVCGISVDIRTASDIIRRSILWKQLREHHILPPLDGLSAYTKTRTVN